MRAAVAGSDWSSSTTSSSFRPRSPPFSLMCLTQSWYPRSWFCPSAAYAPVWASDAPIRSGAWACRWTRADRAQREGHDSGEERSAHSHARLPAIALAPRRRREPRLAGRQLLGPDDDLLAVLPLERHHPVRDLKAVLVDLEGAEDGVQVHRENGVPDLLALEGAGAPDRFQEHLARRHTPRRSDTRARPPGTLSGGTRRTRGRRDTGARWGSVRQRGASQAPAPIVRLRRRTPRPAPEAGRTGENRTPDRHPEHLRVHVQLSELAGDGNRVVEVRPRRRAHRDSPSGPW